MQANINLEIAQMSSQDILEYYLAFEFADENESNEILSQVLKQLRLLMTKQTNQEEARVFLEKQDNFHQFLQKTCQLVQKNVFHINNIDSFFYQFMANFITGNANNKNFLVDVLFSQDEVYFELIQVIYDKISFKDFKLRKFICTFLYNFLKDQKVDIIISKLLNSLSFQHILKQVVVEFLYNESQENFNIKTEQSNTIQTQNQEVQVTYWTLILISLLFNGIQEKNFSLLAYFEFLLVGKEGVEIFQQEDGSYSSKNKKEYSINDLVSNENFEKFQLFMFHVCQQFVDEKVNNSYIKGLEPTIIDIRCQYMNKKDYKFQLNIRDFEYLCSSFITIHQNLYQILKQKNAFENINVDPLDQQEKQNLTDYLNQIHDKLRIFCIITFLGGYNNQLQQKIIDLGLFLDVLELNKQLQQINSLNFDRSKPLINVTKQCLIYFSKESYQDIFSSIIRFLSNVVHINRKAQDFIQNNEYLVSCLNQTHMDETNPLQREWSVMLIRNLCDSNDEMQQAISNLKIFEFNDKTKEILSKYQAKKEELERIRVSIKEGTLLQDQVQYEQKIEESQYEDDEFGLNNKKE